MTDHGKGWIIFLAMLGMMFTLESVEFMNIPSWENWNTPAFWGKVLAHLGTVIGAFLGGRLIPTEEK